MGFWGNFLAGTASGIAVALLAVFARHFFRNSENRSTWKLDKRTLGAMTLGVILISTVGAIIFLAVTGKEIPSILFTIFFATGAWFYWLI